MLAGKGLARGYHIRADCRSCRVTGKNVKAFLAMLKSERYLQASLSHRKCRE